MKDIKLPRLRAPAEDDRRSDERARSSARDGSLAYAGTSDHMRRKLEATMRSAECDAAILRHAIEETRRRVSGS